MAGEKSGMTDSQVSGLGSWMEDGAEEGNMGEEQVWGERLCFLLCSVPDD